MLTFTGFNMPLFVKLHIKTCFFIVLLALGTIRLSNAQAIVIHESDSSWMGKDIPAKALAKKPFSFVRRWFQNTTTRYNYFFNTHETLHQAIKEAEGIHQDHYDSILTLYPYQPVDFTVLTHRLDSVITNAGIGIEIHDPRSKWVHQSYLLIGKSQFYKQDYAQAVKIFRYMIQHLGKKDREDRPKIIGSRKYRPEANISVMTQEEKDKKYPPARNDAFIWLIRAYLKQGNVDKATTLLSSIAEDPNLPKRLQGELDLIQAGFYSQRGKISKAINALQSAISLQEDQKLQARWQYILSQWYEQQGHWQKAVAGYHHVADYKPAPIMKLYAKLRPKILRMEHHAEGYETIKSEIFRIAGKRKFSHFKDIIYLHLGKLALETDHTADGIRFLKKSLTYQTNNQNISTRASLLLANFYYRHHQYIPAKKYYDKASLSPSGDARLQQRKGALAAIVKNIRTIRKEDSLQRLSKLPQDSLYMLLHKTVEDSVRKLKKENLILKGTPQGSSSLATSSEGKQETFHNDNEYEGANWYFYNTKVKARGYNKFKARWGDRSLEDNWRLSNPNAHTGAGQSRTNRMSKQSSEAQKGKAEAVSFADRYFQKLLNPIPTQKEDFDHSVDKEVEAYHDNIKTFYLTLEDDSAALYTIRQLLQKFPENKYAPDNYYKLYLIYKARGLSEKAAQYKNKIRTASPDSKYAQAISKKEEGHAKKDSEAITERLYNKAYRSYQTGNYLRINQLRDRALKINNHNKQKARFDLLYAMTLVKTDSGNAGITALRRVIKDYSSDTPIVRRSRQIIYSIQHKDALIAHLDTLKIDTARDSQSPNIAEEARIQKSAIESQISNEEATGAPENGVQSIPDSSFQKIENHIAANPPPKKNKTVDKAFPPVKQAEEAKKTSPKQENQKVVKDSVESTVSPSSKKKQVPYKIERQANYFVVLYFHKNKTSLLKTAESRFNTYNQKYFSADSIRTSPYVLSHNRLTLILRTFDSERSALSYYTKAQKDLSYEILPQIRPSSLQLFFISKNNFVLMKNEKNLKGYLTFFYKHYK